MLPVETEHRERSLSFLACDEYLVGNERGIGILQLVLVAGLYGTRPVKKNERKPKTNAKFKYQTEKQEWEAIGYKSVSKAKKPGGHGRGYHRSLRL